MSEETHKVIETDDTEPVEEESTTPDFGDSTDESTVRFPRTRKTGRSIKSAAGKLATNPLTHFSKWGVIGGVVFFVLAAGLTGSIIPLAFTALIGVAAAGLTAGLAGRLTYAEVMLAGAIAGALSLAGGIATVESLLPVEGWYVFLLPSLVGILVAVIATYFGRDIRSGLMKEV